MIVVTDTDEATLVNNGTIPGALSTHHLVLRDITFCHAIGLNYLTTYVNPNSLPVGDGAEWLSNVTLQNGPTPFDLCENAPLAI